MRLFTKQTSHPLMRGTSISNVILEVIDPEHLEGAVIFKYIVSGPLPKSCVLLEPATYDEIGYHNQRLVDEIEDECVEGFGPNVDAVRVTFSELLKTCIPGALVMRSFEFREGFDIFRHSLVGYKTRELVNVRGSDFTHCNFVGGIEFKGLDLRGSDFSGSQIWGDEYLILKNCDLRGTLIPDSFFDRGLIVQGCVHDNPRIYERSPRMNLYTQKATTVGLSVIGIVGSDMGAAGEFDLQGIRFEESEIPYMGRRRDFRGCNLSRAVFDGVDLTASWFAGAASLDFASFKGATLESALFPKSEVVGVNFESADLGGAGFEGTFIKCDFKGADLKSASLEGTFIECVFNDAILEDAYLTGTFIDCVFEGARMEGATYSVGSAEGLPSDKLHLMTGLNLLDPGIFDEFIK